METCRIAQVDGGAVFACSSLLRDGYRFLGAMESSRGLLGMIAGAEMSIFFSLLSFTQDFAFDVSLA